MKVIKINKPQVRESREVPGLVSYQMEYEVKSARGRLEYAGPKFTPQTWHQVLSFFLWTHREMKSESQVRLYVNPKLGRWGAWAFPQEAGTGMSARELPQAEPAEKARERFAFWDSEPSDDWLYFGTADHHCSAGAFQSGTDEQNEWNQDGLHLTVGRMDAQRHELHARFYLQGVGFEPDLSRFWPVDPDLTRQVPESMWGELARFQMCEVVEVQFPEAWRRNLVEVQPDTTPLFSQEDWTLRHYDADVPRYWQVEDALEEIDRLCAASAVPPQDWLAQLTSLAQDELSREIIHSCVKHGVRPEEFLATATVAEDGT